MKPNQRILKSFAIILLLVFSQKVGAGLYLHNWLHAINFEQSSPIGSNVVKYSCNCVDDFSMPFAETLDCFDQPITSAEGEFIGFRKFLVPFSPTFFYSLRGPPAFSPRTI